MKKNFVFFPLINSKKRWSGIFLEIMAIQNIASKKFLYLKTLYIWKQNKHSA